ncbi:MAG TPA: hypothetical protein PKJ95_06240 [Atribacterota bacterium]|nr:hypothetical protein [Atribacterota bacterium]
MQEEQSLTEEMVLQILEMRSKARHEEASRLYQAEQRGIEKRNIEIAKNLLKLNFHVEAIFQATRLTAGEIEKLK